MDTKRNKKADTKKAYWLSLEEVERPLEMQERSKKEFLNPPQKQAEELGLDRRSFMKFMGAATMMASLASCTRRPVQKIVPLVNKPEEITPGQPNYYSSVDPLTGQALVLKTREGRPVKVDGNRLHPIFSPALGAKAQAAIYDLYDPDRLRRPYHGDKPTEWSLLDKDLSTILKDRSSTYFLTNTILSSGEKKLISYLSRKHYIYDPIPMEDIRKGQEESFGKEVLPFFRFDKARLIVSIDADFLDTMIAPETFTRDFAKTRDLKNSSMGELIAFESSFRLTGANADKRIAIRPQDQLLIALAIAHEVAAYTGGKATEVLKDFSPKKVEEATTVRASLLKEVSQKLIQNRKGSLLLAGGVGAKSTHALALQNVVNFINASLQNDGLTIDYKNSFELYKGSLSQVKALVRDMEAGKVKNLVIRGVNPIYELPQSLAFKKALRKVEKVIYVSSYLDETSSFAHYVAAENHPFESWGDVSPINGMHSIQQPSIRPLFNTRSFSDSMIVWAKALGKTSSYKNSYELTRSIWRELAYKLGETDFERFWINSLHKGFVDTLASKREQRMEPRAYRISALKKAAREGKKALEELASINMEAFTLLLQPSITMENGRQANNVQLQEIPDPVTKTTWGNYVSISPKTAEKLNLKDSQVIRIKKGNHVVELPVLRQPGIKDTVLVVNLGYGRKMKGRVGNALGVSMIEFLEDSNVNLSFVSMNINIERTERFDPIAHTQNHHSLESRDIIFESTLKDFKKDKSSGIVRHIKLQNIWSGHKYENYRWGMSIDLNKCTGCSSCVMACQVENNVATVGKKEVLRGREMHWIRIDRYFKGAPEDPQVLSQPMLCQHCENAPCETVCPVLATVHNKEGLNVMVYNRCVGTRYCSNNCPYKVRRFNFFEYNVAMNKKLEHPLSLLKNPEVTLRSRGVMEKCSFCIQRIEAGKLHAKREARKVKDGDIVTACQEACPSEAIVFGNMNDPLSKLSEQKKDPRTFSSLEELNTRPSVTYMTKIWNREESKAKNSGGKH